MTQMRLESAAPRSRVLHPTTETLRFQKELLRSRSGPTEMVLIWVQTVCKGYQQMTKVTSSKEMPF